MCRALPLQTPGIIASHQPVERARTAFRTFTGMSGFRRRRLEASGTGDRPDVRRG